MAGDRLGFASLRSSVRGRALLGVSAALGSALLVGCGASSHSGVAAVTTLTQAAYVTTREPGFEFSMKVTANGAGQSVAVTGAGAIDDRAHQGTMTEQVNGRTVSIVFKRPYMYLRLPSATLATGGKPWARANLDVYAQTLGANLSASGTDPTQILNYLRATGHVTSIGAQTVNGVPTTHYHALVDINRAVSTVSPTRRAAAQQSEQILKRATGSSTLPIDVWIDARQHVRRMNLQLRLCIPGGKLSESITFDILRYGSQPAVQIPPPSQVTDITDRLQAQTSRALQQLHC